MTEGFLSFDDLQGGFGATLVGGGIQESAEGLDGVSSLADDFGKIALPHGHVEDRALRCLGLCEDDLVGKFHEAADHVAQELFHGGIRPRFFSAPSS